MSERWQGKNIKNRLRWNNLLKNADRTFSRHFMQGDSIRNRRFMNTLPSCGQVQDWMREYATQPEPFALIRFGLFEHMLCYQFLEKQNGIRKQYSDVLKAHICLDAGLFPVENPALDCYAEFVLSQLNMADVLAYWRNIPEISVFSDFYSPDVRHINVEDLYPFPFWHEKQLPDWQLSLREKRVLVVTAFSETIRSQYEKRRRIWEDAEHILPDFQLTVYQAVQTHGGLKHPVFPSWKEAHDFMLNEILHFEFDIAFISCGAYGIPLALSVKRHGRKAVQWGGCFQLWFGVTGSRWDSDQRIQEYRNDAWVYPSDAETPPLFAHVNGACYWKPPRS